MIEDLKKEHTIAGDAILKTTSAIRCSQQIHIGDYWNMAQLAGMKEGSPLLNKQRLQYMRIPYKLLWVDSLFSGGGKIGALVVDEVTQYEVLAFVYFKDINRWRLNPCCATFNNKKTGYNTYSLPFTGQPLPEDVLQRAENMLGDQLTMVIATMMLLNCKNISTEKILASETLNKKRRKYGKQELFDYHVLNVVVPSARREHLEHTEPLAHNRVHLCRGHFKEYTAEHPLFGRLAGLYWWQPHVRGQNKNGIVMKEYNVINKEAVTA